MKEIKDLWVAVILLAIEDLTKGTEVEQAKARAWLTNGDGFFIDICEYLRVRPNKILKGLI